MRSLALLIVALVTGGTLAQPPRPPAPDQYDIDIRYRIDAFRNERAKQFKEFMARLAELGFKRDADDDLRGESTNEIENTTATRLKGTLPSANVAKVLTLRPVMSVLVKPVSDMALQPDRAIRVELHLAAEVGPARQRLVFEELTKVLRGLGFRQPVGYDHRGYRRLIGTLQVSRLESLLNDVRRAPTSWSELSKTLLNDMRAAQGGAESLRALLDAWNADPEGAKLLTALAEGWAQLESGYRMIHQLPPLVVNDTTLMTALRTAIADRKPLAKETNDRLVALVRGNEVVREQLLLHLQSFAQAGPLLDKLLSDALKSPNAGKLVDVLLRRLEGRQAAVVLPQLFRPRQLVRLIEARPDLPLPTDRLPPPEQTRDPVKIEQPLLVQVKDPALANVVGRVDVLLNFTPDPNRRRWLEDLETAAPSLILEGRLGPLLSVRMKAGEVQALARLGIVSAIRPPRKATSAVLRLPDDEGDPAAVLKATGLDEVLRQGKPARPVRVAVIDSDFRGWESLVKKQLPFNTRLIDLTAERNDNLKGDTVPDAPGALGTGTLTSLAVARAAPWCELLLVRIDAACPHMVGLVHGRLLGRTEFGESLLARRQALVNERSRLDSAYAALLKERVEVFKLFADDKPQTDALLKQRQELLDAYRQKHTQHDLKENAYKDQERVFLTHVTGLRDLAGVRVVVCGLDWKDSLPADGGSALARQLDDTQGGRFLWIQAVGNARAQAWTGLFRDVENNGALEFADESVKLPAGHWSHEKAFLAFEPLKGERSSTIPARTKVRITLQWREAQDASFARDGDDPYRVPLNTLRLLVLKQLDPEGKKQPADDLAIVAETLNHPVRIAVDAGSAVYEQVIELTADAAARLALRVEGKATPTMRPPGTLELASDRRNGELKLRLFIETLEGEGRVVFDHYATRSGEIGVPADAARAFTVGAVDVKGKERSYSTLGAPFGVELSRRPELSTFDRLGLDGAKNVGGSGMAAGLVGGCAAALLGQGTRWEDLLVELRQRLGK